MTDVKRCPLSSDFRRAAAGFPSFCLETWFGWLACNLLPGAQYRLRLEESHYQGNIQTFQPPQLQP